jgi:tRNA pseudouridine38-40 synthase
MTVAYDGTDFAGFQVQRERRTVQGTLETALAAVTGATVRVEGAGRTDAGVHATGQTVSCRLPEGLAPAQLRRALNAQLPEDVVVQDLAEAPPSFHARFSARGRGYRYTIWNAPVRNVREQRRVYHWRSWLDVDAMNDGAQTLLGRHDFTAFSGSLRGRTQPTTAVRTLFRLHCWRDRDYVVIDAAADAFLPRMVRNLVGTLVPVGMGQRRARELAEILASGDRGQAGPTVPARGLCLTQVWYD